MRSLRLGPLGVRLALAFVAVAVGAVVVLGGLTLVSARGQVSTLVRRQQDQAATSVAAALAGAYEAAGGWANADLGPAYTLAASAQATLEVRDAGGAALPEPPLDMTRLMARMHGTSPTAPGAPAGVLAPPRTVPVQVGATRVGTALLRFPASGLPGPERQVRDALERTVVAGAGAASLLALGVALFVSGRITRPLVRLTRTARAVEAGDRAARARLSAPGELGELASAFDHMCDALDREDDLRRALVADVAHELRTPLTILQANCEVMVDGIVAPTPERLSSLHDEVLRLGRIVEDLGTLASAEAAGLRLERRPVDLAGIAHRAAELLAPRFAATDIALVERLDPVTVDGDATRLSQVALNLLTNALKFTPAGGQVTLEVGADGALARLEVSDTGPGIPDEELPHVFERFWRGEAARRSGGSGIGLAVVAELVRAHHGRVEVAHGPGGGTRFSVLLPAG